MYQTMAWLRHYFMRTEGWPMLLVLLIPPRGPSEREEEHAMCYYSGGSGQRLLAIPSALSRTWLEG